MPLLTAKMTVKCPKEDKEVQVKSECSKCNSFAHISYQGSLMPLIACKHEKERVPETKKTEEKEEESALKGLKKWV